MRVLLVWPKARTDPDWGGDLGAVAEPLALEYLSATATSEGHETRVLDLRLRPEALAETLESFQPDVVGVTAFSMHVRAALEACRATKQTLPECFTVAGGHHATFLPEDFFEPQMDAVVVGEGVAPFRSLLRALEQGRNDQQLPGVWQRREGEFVFGGQQPKLRLEELPRPDRTVTAADRQHYFIDWMKPVALLRTSVGCPYRCTFCSVWQIVDGKYYTRSNEDVVAEVAEIPEEFVFLVDDEAFIQKKRMIELARALKAAGLEKRYFAYCRMDTLVRHQDVLEAWRDVGLERLMIGIDAISKKDLNEYRKGYQVAQIEAGFKAADELGIEVLAQFVVNTDYTREDFRQMARFVEHHRVRYPSFTVLTPLPGTDLLESFDEITELQPNGRPNWDLFDTQNAVTSTRLPKQVFRTEYRKLFQDFRGSYSQYMRFHFPTGEGATPGAPPRSGFIF